MSPQHDFGLDAEWIFFATSHGKSPCDWIVPGTQSSHHFILLSSSKIAHKLSSEDKSHAGTHDFDLPTTSQLCDIRPMTYVTCLYDSFLRVGLVTKADVEQGDAKIQFMFPHGPCKTFN